MMGAGGPKAIASDSVRLPVVSDPVAIGDKPVAAEDPSLIHPWDIPQGKDTTRTLRDDNTWTTRTSGDWDNELSEDPQAAKAAADAALPQKIDIAGNYPNPFNAETNIRFNLQAADAVTLEIFNLLGQTVRSEQLTGLSAGRHVWNWDGRVTGGQSAPSGVYFYRISTTNSSAIAKMVLLK